MTRWRIEPAGPAGVEACGMRIPVGGIERDLDDATLGLLEGDARVTVKRAEPPAKEAPRTAPRRGRHKRD